MNTLVLVVISIAVLVCGYIFYGGWLCKQWGVGDSKEETPAHTMEDGIRSEERRVGKECL